MKCELLPILSHREERALDDYEMGGKPFQGLVFCPTSVPSTISQQICKKIEKLGGIFTKDLTRLVNVLICGELFTPKYNFAIQNRTDVVFVKPDCITALYDMWLSGQDLLELSENSMIAYVKRNYSIAPFELFNIFIGRISSDNPIYSMQHLIRLCELGKVRRLDTQHYIRNVENIHPTVFITDDLSGHRVRAAVDENVPVVHPKWILDCMDRYGTLDYNKYYLLENCQDLSFEDIGKGSHIRLSKVPSTLPSGTSDAKNNNKLTPTSVVSAERDPFLNPLKISIEKLKPQANQIWGNLLSREDVNPKQQALDCKTYVPNENSINLVSSSVFENCHFFLYEFQENQQNILGKVISQNKGTCSILGDSEYHKSDKKYFYICSSRTLITRLPSIDSNAAIIENSWLTEFFIERCLYYECLLEPDYWCKPFYNTFQVLPPATICHGKKLTFHITGFHGVELLHVNKLVDVLKELGFEQHERLSKTTDVLIANISQLTSIPSDHPLRKNKYASMSRTDLELKISQKQVRMFRNSMKRKIEFVKNSHQIPILAPSFIIELFQRSRKTPATIYFNDVNWCISCPKGSKSDFSLEITPLKKRNDDACVGKQNETASNSPSVSSESDQPNIIKRRSRWGKLLSNTMDTQKECDEPSVIEENDREDDTSHTQVTYGSSATTSKRRRILTRGQLKEITS